MANLENYTVFGADSVAQYDLSGTMVLVVLVTGRFVIPRAAHHAAVELECADEQPPPCMVDEHWGEPNESSLRCSGNAVFYRPGTDITVVGSACAPASTRVRELRTKLTVGSYRKDARIVGDRFWQSGIIGLKPSEPQPFERIPLIYERAYGGIGKSSRRPKWEPRNPVGCGVYDSKKDAIDQPLPNIEAPAEPIATWSQEATPWGYGPVSRTWAPRVAFGGTFDEAWIEKRAPLWPTDFDSRFFRVAAPGLHASPYLEGGESVFMGGFSHDGSMAFTLPKLRFSLKSHFASKALRGLMRLVDVSFETDEGVVTLVWTRSVPMGRGKDAHIYSSIRLLESWEESPSERQ